MYIQLFLLFYSVMCLLSTLVLKSMIDIFVFGLATVIFILVMYILYSVTTKDNCILADRLMLL